MTDVDFPMTEYEPEPIEEDADTPVAVPSPAEPPEVAGDPAI